MGIFSINEPQYVIPTEISSDEESNTSATKIKGSLKRKISGKQKGTGIINPVHTNYMLPIDDSECNSHGKKTKTSSKQKGSGRKLYACRDCPKEFVRKDSLQRHEENKHISDLESVNSEPELSEKSTENARNIDTDSNPEETLSPESLKLILHFLKNGEMGHQTLTKYSLISVIEESDPEKSEKEEGEIIEYESSDDKGSYDEYLTKRQIGCLMLVVKSSKNAAKVLTKPALINIVKNLE